jgi:hypothetical protein
VEVVFGNILQQCKCKTGFKITSFQKNFFTNFSFQRHKNSSKSGKDMSTGWQTADGPKFDTPRNEEQGRPGVQRIKEICDAVAEKGLGEVQRKLIEKSGDWKSEQISEVNEQAHTHTHTHSFTQGVSESLYKPSE